MIECQIEPAIRSRLAAEESLSKAQINHLPRCERCRELVARAASLDATLSRAAATLVTAELPEGTLQIARSHRSVATTKRLALAAVAAATMILALAGAAVYAGLVPPTFDDHALRTDAAAYMAFEACLGEAGYTPRPMPMADSPIEEGELSYDRAFQRCIVASGIGEVDGDDPAEVAYANWVATGVTECLRHEGWDLPDPEMEPLGRYLEPPSGVVTDDPEVQAQFNGDLAACGDRYGIKTYGTPEEAP